MKLRVLVLGVLMALTAPAVRAQGADSVVRGTVVDSMQAAVANAEVTITGGTSPAALRTDAAGQFSIALADGTYAITAVAPGFAPATASLVVRGGQSIAPRIALAVAGLHENVTVTASGTPMVSSATRTATPLRDVPQSVT